MKRILLGICFFLCTILITGCNNDPKPEDALKKFVSNWEEQAFEKLYTQFSSDTVTNVKNDEFVERYKKIFGDIEADKLNVEVEFPKEEVEPNEKGEVSFPFDVSMETIAGPISFSEKVTLVLEESDDKKEWLVKWKPSMFFPGMEEGDEIGLTISTPTRGEIVDRNGVVLAENGLVYEIGLVPKDLGDDKNKTIGKVASLLKLSEDSILDKLNASWVQPDYFVPVKKLSLSDQELATKVTQLNGVLSKKVESRVYPFGKSAAHLIGYIGTVTAEDLEKLEGKGYSGTDVIGKKGLEMVFEDRLRGEEGAHLFIKKAGDQGEVTLADKPAKDGETIKLTIDIDVQRTAFENLGGLPGAVAAIHPKTGEALALASSPSFDPNTFVLGISSDEWTKLNEDPLKPLLNRFGLTYAPGSTFKPITAGIALENAIIEPSTSINVKGKQWKKDDSWGGYSVTRVTDPGGPVDLRKALVLSDNIYFAQTALKIGGDLFESELEKYGFGESFPFEYPLYDSMVSNDGLNNEVLLADTGYGQGELQMSPVHLAIAYTPFVNEGNLISPRLVFNEQGEVKIWKENVITPENAQIILEDLKQVVADPNGTAKDVKIPGLELAGKTGTAELKGSGEEEGLENGWFVGVDTENPELLVAMIIENVANGSHDVTPRVKAIFEDVIK